MPQIYRDNHSSLSKLLEEAGANGNATLLIPDIQRPYVWSPRQVTLLVDSLLRGWPFGSLLLWSVGKDQVAKMPWREFTHIIDRVDSTSEGVSTKQQPATYRMVLDGQQRVQSLLLAFGKEDWGFKLKDAAWNEVMKDKKPRGRAASHWSLGLLCLDLVELQSAVKSRKFAHVDFSSGPLTWATLSSKKHRSETKRSRNYAYPLEAADDPECLGRFVRLSRLWDIAGDQSIQNSEDYEEAVKDLFEQHTTQLDLANELQKPLEDMVRKLREVRDTRVTFLEVDQYDKKWAKNRCIWSRW